MRSCYGIVASTALMAFFLAGRNACGGLLHHHDGVPAKRHAKPIPHTQHRAGHPFLVSPHAEPSNTESFNGYYVGGGAAWHGEPRYLEEGTWGWDYVGGHLSRNVFLQWSHGRRYQGGSGAYQTDGPVCQP